MLGNNMAGKNSLSGKVSVKDNVESFQQKTAREGVSHKGVDLFRSRAVEMHSGLGL